MLDVLEPMIITDDVRMCADSFLKSSKWANAVSGGVFSVAALS